MKTESRQWLEAAARVGYATKGVVYVLVGALAVMSVLGAGGALGGSETAVQTIGDQPFGKALLALTGVGLACYAAWRFVQAYYDPGHSSEGGASQLARRAGHAGSGVLHVSLALTAFQLAMGEPGGSSGGARTFVSELLHVETFGPVLAVAAGALVIGFALRQVYRAFVDDVSQNWNCSEVSATTRRWVERIARGGLAARGVVFAIIGVGVVRAGLHTDASHAGGVGDALRDLGSQPQGAFILIVVACGLVAYGLAQLTNARLRTFPG